MKAYKLELYILDSDELGAEEIKDVIENTKYPNHCINPEVMDIKSADIGEWYDDHPLNKTQTFKNEYKKLSFK